MSSKNVYEFLKGLVYKIENEDENSDEDELFDDSYDMEVKPKSDLKRLEFRQTVQDKKQTSSKSLF